MLALVKNGVLSRPLKACATCYSGLWDYLMPAIAGSYLVKSKAATYLLFFFAYLVSPYVNIFIIGNTIG